MEDPVFHPMRKKLDRWMLLRRALFPAHALTVECQCGTTVLPDNCRRHRREEVSHFLCELYTVAAHR